MIRSSAQTIRMSLPLLAALAVLVAIGAGVAYWQLGVKEKSARDAASRFAAALVDNDPAAAPAGGREYVAGVRAYFGPVRAARVIGARNKTVRDRFPAVDDRGRTHTFPVAQLLLRTKRGPAVIEVEFDSGALLGSGGVTAVHELEPYEAPGRAADRQLAAAFASRGGKPADQVVLSGAAPAPQPAESAPVGQTRAPTSGARHLLDRAEKQLRCIERANGDAAKLQECARS